MLFSLLLTASLCLLVFGVYRQRVIARLRRLEAEAEDRCAALAAENAQMARKLDELAALDQSKSRILAALVNDMRTPLMLVMAPLQRAAGDCEAEIDVPALLGQAGRLKQRVEQLVALLEVELQSTQLRLVQGDLVGLLEQRVAALRPLAERLQTALDFEPGADRLPFAFDRDKIGYVFDGLFRRVFEDVAPGDRVRVSVTRRATPEGERAVVEILDTGRRLSERRRRLLCEGVHWADPADAEPDPTGLGLALAHRFVHLHGGEVRVDDETSIGTRVQVSLPVARAAAPQVWGDALPVEAPEVVPVLLADEAAPTLPSVGDDESKKTTVLVVDDHAGTRGYLSFALRKHHRVLEAANGQEALALVREHLPDLVISDIMMPVMDGQTLCRTIKNDPALNHIPVFLVTANAVADVKREGLEAGADDYLTKPFDLEEAVMRINNMITLRSQLRLRYSREVVIKPSDIIVTSADETFLDRARQTVEDHMEDGAFGVQELASELGMSPRQLQRRLRETVNQSPVEFIRMLRLQRAAQLLERQYGNVSEVAYAVGFTSLSYFAKCFREQFGRSPSEFKSEQAA